MDKRWQIRRDLFWWILNMNLEKRLQGKIVLIDEVHTCDSSRYWIKETYKQRMAEGSEPEKLDKDCVSDWVKSVCDPYKDPIPEIPYHIIQKAYK